MPERAKVYTRKPGFKVRPPGEAARPTAAGRGYTYGWQKARLLFLSENPLCADCNDRGEVETATVVDHKIPHRGNPVLFWDVENWQSLCTQCHNRKTRKGL
jgi:5-methylcytosine-specific restriction endonuclease McrA